LLPILHEIQHAFGHVPAEAVRPISSALNISRAEVHGAISFYHDFRREPAAKPVIKLCRAEACQARGIELLAPLFEDDPRIEVETVYCLGLCASGPNAMVGAEVHARLDEEKARQLIDKTALA
jgi:formate dehydrogenase subunit gamma